MVHVRKVPHVFQDNRSVGLVWDRVRGDALDLVLAFSAVLAAAYHQHDEREEENTEYHQRDVASVLDRFT